MPTQNRSPRAARGLAIIGAIGSAAAATSCCLGPLALATLGLGGAGALAVLGAYRIHVFAISGAFLAGASILAYRARRATAGAACDCSSAPRAPGRFALWSAIALVGALLVSPTLLAQMASARSTSVAEAGTVTTVIHVAGADCDACQVHLRRALTPVGGFRSLTLNVAAQTVTVAYEPAPGRLEAYVAAINELGYEASLPNAAVRGTAAQ
jgi:copper chaperone CopZ